MSDDGTPETDREDSRLAAMLRAMADGTSEPRIGDDEADRLFASILAAREDPELQRLGDEARRRIGPVYDDTTVVPFRQMPRWAALTALAAALSLTVGIGSWVAIQRTMSPASQITYRDIVSGNEPPRMVSLEDGSEITLDARSKVRVLDGRNSRKLALLEGRAFFKVAHDRVHPFTVDAAGSRVTALGTAFSVANNAGGTEVVLAEGRVRIDPPAGDRAEPAYLTPNQRWKLGKSGLSGVSGVDAASVSSWKGGYISFDDQSVSEVLTQLNRYAPNPLVLIHQADAGQRISGTFQLGNPREIIDTFTAMGIETRVSKN